MQDVLNTDVISAAYEGVKIVRAVQGDESDMFGVDGSAVVDTVSFASGLKDVFGLWREVSAASYSKLPSLGTAAGPLDVEAMHRSRAPLPRPCRFSFIDGLRAFSMLCNFIIDR